MSKPVISVPVSPTAQISILGQKRDTKSVIVIQIGTVKVAGGVLGGKYNEQQALREFKNKNPKLKLATGAEELAETVRKML